MSDTEKGSMTRGGDGSHWAGCEKVHWDCALDAKDAEIARLRRERDEARVRADRYEKALQDIRFGKRQEDNTHPLGEAWSMVFRFSNIARAALSPQAGGKDSQ